jgi:rhodanese-related sulfurtransferase
MNTPISFLIVVTFLGLIAPAAQAEDPVKNVTPKEAAQLLKEKKALQPIDVRTPDEFGDGHIAGAKNLNVLDAGFKGEVAKLDSTQPVLVYCRSGGRSSRALMTFRELGFKMVYHLEGGLMDWEDAGLDIEE